MRRITAISLLVASAVTIGALPANAQGQGLGTTARVKLQRTVYLPDACAKSFADARCISHQRRMIATAASTKTVSPEEAGKRQLDALMRTIG